MRRKKSAQRHQIITERDSVLSKEKLTQILILCEEEPEFRRAVVNKDYSFLMKLKREMDGADSARVSSYDLERVEVITAQADHYTRTGNVGYWFNGGVLERDEYAGRLIHLGRTTFLESEYVQRVRTIKDSLFKGGVAYHWAKPLGSEDVLFASKTYKKAELLRKSPPPAKVHPWRRSFRFGTFS